MGKFLGQPCGLNVTGVQVDFVSGVVNRCQRLSLVVVPCHVTFCLYQSGSGLLQGVFHLLGELVDRF